MAEETYLVTGGCGFIGSHIVEKLLKKYPSARVAVLSRNPKTNTFPRATYHAGDVASTGDVASADDVASTGDVASADDVTRIVNEVRPTVVFHCAGMMTVGRKTMADEFVRAINVDGTRNVLEAGKKVGVKAFVTTSSASVVQKEMFRDIVAGDEGLGLAEEGDDTLIYPKTKAASDQMTLEYDDPKGMRTCTLRPAAVHGERDNDITPNLMRNYHLGRNKVQMHMRLRKG